MSVTLKKRLDLLEEKIGSQSKPLVILTPPFAMPRFPGEAELTAPLNDRGQAWISRFWGCTITEGSAQEREKILAGLRADPQYQTGDGPTSEPFGRCNVRDTEDLDG